MSLRDAIMALPADSTVAPPPATPLDPRLASAIAVVRASIETAATALDAAQVALGALVAQLPRDEPTGPPGPATADPGTCAHPDGLTVDTAGGNVLVCPPPPHGCGANVPV